MHSLARVDTSIAPPIARKGGAGRGAGDMAGPEAPGSGGRQAQPKRKRQQQQQQQQQQRQGQQQQRQPKAPPQHVEVGLYADVKAFQRQQRVARARAGGADPDSATRPVAEIRETPVCRCAAWGGAGRGRSWWRAMDAGRWGRNGAACWKGTTSGP